MPARSSRTSAVSFPSWPNRPRQTPRTTILSVRTQVRCAMTAETIAKALGARKAGNGWTVRYPAHDDRNPSLSISAGKDGKVLLRCHAGCDQAQVIDALRARGLWELRERHSIKRRTYKANPQKDTPHDRNDADKTEYPLGICKIPTRCPTPWRESICSHVACTLPYHRLCVSTAD